MFSSKRVLVVALVTVGTAMSATSAARTNAVPRRHCTRTYTRPMFIRAVQATYAGTRTPRRGAYGRLWRYARCGRTGRHGYRLGWARAVWGIGLSQWERRLAVQAAQNVTTRFDGWAIPSRIVYCESGYANLAPNSAGASGYYQMLPGTWQEWGGGRYSSEAYQASRDEQGVVAAYGYDHDGTGPWSASQGCWG